MNIVDQIYIYLVYLWTNIDKAALSAGVTAFIVALLRMWRFDKIVISEALLCGVFAAIAVTGASFIIAVLGIPADGWVHTLATGGSSVVAGFIGWYGTERTIKYAEDKVKGDKDGSDGS